jgi:hypothetical protein
VDTLIGILGLAVYITCILALSAAITFAVIKISPSQSAKKREEEPTG